MKNSIINSVVAQAIQTTSDRYTLGHTKVDSAKAGRGVITDAHITRRRNALSRFGMRCLLKKAGILECDIPSTVDKLTDHLVDLKEQSTICEDAFNTFVGASWNWGAFHDQRLSAFSVKVDDIWMSYNDKEDVKDAILSIHPTEWMSRGFWDALRWLIDNHEGVEAINDSEFFKVNTLSDIFKIRGQLTWWASFKDAAQKGFNYHEERLAQSEEDYRLSGGCNTHYVGEQQDKWEAAGKRLEKAVEADDLMNNPAVEAFIKDLCNVFRLAGKDQPMAGEYSAEVEREKQLATMEKAAEMAMQAVTMMVQAAIEKGRLAA